jgi:hypothetical protein
MKKAIPAITVGAALAASLLLAAPAQATPPSAPSGLQISVSGQTPTGYSAYVHWSSNASSMDSYPTDARITTSAGYSGLAGSGYFASVPIPADFTSVVVSVTLLHNDEAGAPATVTLTRPAAPSRVRAKLVQASMVRGCLNRIERSPAFIRLIGSGPDSGLIEYQAIKPGKKAWKTVDGGDAIILKKASQAGTYKIRGRIGDYNGVLTSPWSSTFKIKVTARQITATKSLRMLATRSSQIATRGGC